VASPIRPAAGIRATAAVTKTHIDAPVAAAIPLRGATTNRTFSQLDLTLFQSCDAIDTS
jgi:hypothetical protein